MTPARVLAELDLAETLGPGEGPISVHAEGCFSALAFGLLLGQPKAGGPEDLLPSTTPGVGGGCAHCIEARTEPGGSISVRPGCPPLPPHLHLHHGWPLGPQHLHCLEDVHHTLVPHPLQHDAECNEDARPAHTSTVRESAQVSSGVGVSGSLAQLPNSRPACSEAPCPRDGRSPSGSARGCACRDSASLHGQLTCSGQRWGRPGRTAPWSCALGR